MLYVLTLKVIGQQHYYVEICQVVGGCSKLFQQVMTFHRDSKGPVLRSSGQGLGNTVELKAFHFQPKCLGRF
jgi:hypothetical protein